MQPNDENRIVSAGVQQQFDDLAFARIMGSQPVEIHTTVADFQSHRHSSATPFNCLVAMHVDFLEVNLVLRDFESLTIPLGFFQPLPNSVNPDHGGLAWGRATASSVQGVASVPMSSALAAVTSCCEAVR